LQELDGTIGGDFTEASVPPDVDAALPAWRYRLAVVQHYRGVYRVARALLGDASEAEDVVQEAFVRYWQQRSAVRRPREWLTKVARNACFDRLRRTRRLVSDSDVEVAETSDDRDPTWHYRQNELAAQLQRALDELPEPQRSLVVLFDVQGLSGEECARIVGINVNQVKVYLHRARKKLRLHLEQSS
jgi:RNA polymerase sigma-70 factor (ECF subfamily)